MNFNNHRPPGRGSGMSLLELTVVILILLSLVAILFIGARGWKMGSDRTACVLNIRNGQIAIRTYANNRGLDPGAPIPGGVTRRSVISGPGLYLPTWPVCPGGGVYDGQELTTIPEKGTVVMACNFSSFTDVHLPDQTEDW